MGHLCSYMIMHKVVLGVSHNMWGNKLLGTGLRTPSAFLIKAVVNVENSNTLSE